MMTMMRCAGCGTERARGQTCLTCELVNDPIPMSRVEARRARRRWDASEERYRQMCDQREARIAKIGIEAHEAETEDGLRSIGVLH